ncbi:MAG: nitroreductase family protein, partial [Candidatus Omnitrophota bacterium]|nr:nitroreductase family protein [Candidatus Omnitrophota bacterium]
MQTYEAITKRRSIREFQDKEISRDDLIKLVDAGRLAATARNEQPWEFVVVSEKDKKTEIARITGNNGAFIASAGAVIAVFCLDSKYYIEDGSAATENI